MTSQGNTTTAESSYSNIAFSGEYVIDGSNTTYWESSHSQYDNSGNYIGITSTNYNKNGNSFVVAGEWVQINLPSAALIRNYFVGILSTNIPKSWILLGSNDQTTWNHLDSFAYSTNIIPTYNLIPLMLSTNNTTYSSYRLVISSTFGGTDTVRITEYRLLTAGTTPLLSPYQIRPIPLKNYILHPIRILNDSRNIYSITDLCGNLIREGSVNGKYYMSTVITGLTTGVSSQTYDGYNHIICSLSGELSCMTNSASLTNLYWTDQIRGQTASTSRTFIHSCCYNTKHILLAGDGISYAAIGNNQYNALFHETNASSLFSGGAVHCVASNSGYGHVVMHNTLYLEETDTLSLITPKYYADGLNERTQITMKGYMN